MISHLPFISGAIVKCAFDRSILFSSDQTSVNLQCNTFWWPSFLGQNKQKKNRLFFPMWVLTISCCTWLEDETFCWLRDNWKKSRKYGIIPAFILFHLHIRSKTAYNDISNIFSISILKQRWNVFSYTSRTK